jgi:hypothetical protein
MKGRIPWAAIRIGFVVLGGMLVLQSSGTLDVSKVIYLAGVLVAASASGLKVVRNRSHPAVQASRAWFAWSAALILLIAVSFLVSHANGTQGLNWLRDAATYGLVALVPVVALDAAISLPRRGIVVVLVALGLLGACSWAVVWLERRAILELPLDRLLYAAPQIPITLYLVAMATAIVLGRSGLSWALLAGVVLSAFLITATRSSLVFLTGPAIMAAAAGWRRLPISLAWILVHSFLALALLLAFQAVVRPGSAAPAERVFEGLPGQPAEPSGGPAIPAIASPNPANASPYPPNASPSPVGVDASATAKPDVIKDRIGEIGKVLAAPQTDASFRERVAQYAAAWRLFWSAPFLGVGPGYLIEWTDASGVSRAAYTADTPVVYLSKFGLAGLAVLSLLIWAYTRTLVVILRATGRTVASLTMIGFATISVAMMPFGFPLEDKGTSLALIVILALAFMEFAPTAGDPLPREVRPAVGSGW